MAGRLALESPTYFPPFSPSLIHGTDGQCQEQQAKQLKTACKKADAAGHRRRIVFEVLPVGSGSSSTSRYDRGSGPSNIHPAPL